MDHTILGAIIGAAGAILINGFIYELSKKNSIKRDKIEIITEIISNLYRQIRYSKRSVSNQIWLNYYHRTLPLLMKNMEVHLIANNKIDERIRMIEEYELKFIESDENLIRLSAKYRSYYPKDKEFVELLRNIVDYVIDNNITIEDFKKWNNKELIEIEKNNKIRTIIEETHNKLDASFNKMIMELIEYLENKLDKIN